ncbi:succinyl-diaminopimelate desuccinylase [Psittacicella hinzii]|uniref:Succinyl-diaminopimelate desuccinylase n=1 Tax=Psittacicella hinzii TaxID=2028575 RepID=A0A3A1YJQ7_9GAMM|nr:succinyl-diaminopimelate desuccinylase [Psittacicella hinzii]RIY37811.1 succinyl-diaminopimelate desuccinylase [Psittacicella hinzii]
MKKKLSSLVNPTGKRPYYLDPLATQLDYLGGIATLQELVSRNTVTPADDQTQEDIAKILKPYGFVAINFSHHGITNTLYVRLGAKSQLASTYSGQTGRPWTLNHGNTGDFTDSTWEQVYLQYLSAKAAGVKLSWANFPAISDLPVFLFAGHTDVVPPGNLEQWTLNDPFDPQVHEQVPTANHQATNPYSTLEDVDYLVSATQGLSPAAEFIREFPAYRQALGNRYLYHPEQYMVGRGTTDMKGGLVASIYAVTALLDVYAGTPEIEQVTLAFLLTSDEEAAAVDGTKYVVTCLEEVQQNVAWCIIAEPSSSAQVGDVIRNGRRGSASWWLTVQGEQGHVAYPHLVDNPIHRLVPLLNALQTELMNLDQGNSEFPATSFQLVELAAGDGTTNLVPGTARAQFNLRFNNEHTYTSLQAKVNSIIDRFPELKDKLTVQSTCSGESFVTPQASPFCQDATKVITTLTRGNLVPKFDTGGGTSDGRFLTRICEQMFELGTTNATLHKVNEHVILGEFYELMQIYYCIMLNTFGLIALDGDDLATMSKASPEAFNPHLWEKQPSPQIRCDKE